MNWKLLALARGMPSGRAGHRCPRRQRRARPGDCAQSPRSKGASARSSEITAIVKPNLPGKILGVELEVEDNGSLVYEFDVIDARGKLLEVDVDAATGKILSIEDDD